MLITGALHNFRALRVIRKAADKDNSKDRKNLDINVKCGGSDGTVQGGK